MKYKKTLGSVTFDAVNTILLIALAVVSLYPYLYVFSASLSDPVEFYRGSKFVLFPRGFRADQLQNCFQKPHAVSGLLQYDCVRCGGNRH